MNPPNAEEHLSTNGSDWLWTVFSIMALSTLLAAGATIMVSPPPDLCILTSH